MWEELVASSLQFTFVNPKSLSAGIIHLDFLLIAFYRAPSEELPSIVIFTNSAGIFAELN